MASPGIERSIGGIKVQFPCKPYPSQFSMMNKIIQGLQRQQNCLLESPTGSGKSLALLCSCLAWQKTEMDKQVSSLRQTQDDCCNIDIAKKEENKNCQCCCHQPQGTVGSDGIPQPASKSKCFDPNSQLEAFGRPDASVSFPQQVNKNNNSSATNAPSTDVKDGSQDEDFKPAQKKFRTPAQRHGRSKFQKGVVYEDDPEDLENLESSPTPWQMQIRSALASEMKVQGVLNAEAQCTCTCQCAQRMLESSQMDQEIDQPRIKIPKIFFGTRTHKQITQIIRELKKTAYKNVNMVILASREYYCVHPHISKSSNKNEGCKQMLEKKNNDTCSYYQHVNLLKSQKQLRHRGVDSAWDVEDLVTLGKKLRVCPYFAVRGLMDDAAIIFCPYSYLIDPKIRNAMEIHLKNQIIILDEAHNIEDSCREAASFKVTQDELEETMNELDQLIAMRIKAEDMLAMREMCVGFVRWIHNMAGTLQQTDFEKSQRVWSGVDFVAVLDSMAITPLTIPMLTHSYANIISDNFDPSKPDEMSLSSHAASLLEGLFIILDYLFRENMKYMHDYRIALEKTRSNYSYATSHGGWMTTRRGDRPWTYTIHFWCMNPAVAFSDISSCSRSIVLTSGTLSPMASFSSELGALFPIQLEANHVIHNSQMWVGTVATGPNGGVLNATYKFAETYGFQDELGAVVLRVCQSIPYGVLCFVPSYNMMEKLCKRWRGTGLWNQLERRKLVICEPRGGDKADFDDLLRQFYDVILESECSDQDSNSVTGALFLAVCRGKVSEGLDFADNNARAVITVGIPFPNIKDTVVNLKKKYNNEHASTRRLLSGNEWYEIQAYRALNQALGRCIRHRQDWGALILVDERFGKNPAKYIKGLSKWVRQHVKHYYRFSEASASLDCFAKARLSEPCPDISLSLNSSIGVLTPAPCSQAEFCGGGSVTPSQDSTRTPVSKPRAMGYQRVTQTVDLTEDSPIKMPEPSQVSSTPSQFRSNRSTQFMATGRGSETVSRKSSSSALQPSIAGFLQSPRPDSPAVLNSPSATVTPATCQTKGVDSCSGGDWKPPTSVFSPAFCSVASKTEASQPQLPTLKGKLDFGRAEDGGGERLPPTCDVAANDKGRRGLKQFAYQKQQSPEEGALAVNTQADQKICVLTPKCVGALKIVGSAKLFKFVKIPEAEAAKTHVTSSTDAKLPPAEDELNCTPPLFDDPEPQRPEDTTHAAQSSQSQVTSSSRPTNRKRLFRLLSAGKGQAGEATDCGAESSEVSAPLRKTPRGRKRKGTGGGKEEGKLCKTAKGSVDLLDELDSVKLEPVLQGDSRAGSQPCRPGVYCVKCDSCLVSQLDEIKIMSEEPRCEYFASLCGKYKKPVKEAQWCSCVNHDSHVAVEQTLDSRAVLVDKSQVSDVLVPVPEQSNSALRFNCHLSEEDQCCYRPMVCAGCKVGGKKTAKPVVIGLQVIAFGEKTTSNLGIDGGTNMQVWLFPQAVRYCPNQPICMK